MSKKQFLEECGVDLTDYEYAGKFPSKGKDGTWGNIPRGEGWKRYAEWLEQQLAEKDAEYKKKLDEAYGLIYEVLNSDGRGAAILKVKLEVKWRDYYTNHPTTLTKTRINELVSK
jgi:hypothetical protein